MLPELLLLDTLLASTGLQSECQSPQGDLRLLFRVFVSSSVSFHFLIPYGRLAFMVLARRFLCERISLLYILHLYYTYEYNYSRLLARVGNPALLLESGGRQTRIFSSPLETTKTSDFINTIAAAGRNNFIWQRMWRPRRQQPPATQLVNHQLNFLKFDRTFIKMLCFSWQKTRRSSSSNANISLGKRTSQRLSHEFVASRVVIS